MGDLGTNISMGVKLPYYKGQTKTQCKWKKTLVYFELDKIIFVMIGDAADDQLCTQSHHLSKKLLTSVFQTILSVLRQFVYCSDSERLA